MFFSEFATSQAVVPVATGNFTNAELIGVSQSLHQYLAPTVYDQARLPVTLADIVTPDHPTSPPPTK